MAVLASIAAAALAQAAPTLTLPYLEAPPVVKPAPAPVLVVPLQRAEAVPPSTNISETDVAAAAFTTFVRSLEARAIAAGVSAATFDRETAGLAFDPRVVRADRAQPGGGGIGAPSATLDFAPYRRQHVDAAHISGGRRRYPALRPQLAAIEARTGVPEAIMLAIYGHETGYGSFSGRTDLLRSFASLAYDGRRRDLFAGEFVNTLLLIDRGVARSRLVGSWAGATGYPQFLPSAYLRLGTDGDGDGRIDIWTSEADALASIGRYLQDAGWKPNVPWAVAATVPPELDRATIASPLTSPRCPRVHARLGRWRTLAEWKALGLVVTGTPAPPDDEQTTLIEPDGPGAPAYLATSNYQVILDYNCSNLYALSVGVLADEIVR